MSLHASEIALIVTRIDRTLRGAVVREVLSERTSNRVALTFRGIGENHYFRICLDPTFCRIGRVTERPQCADVPHPFVMLLRKTLVGKRLTALTALDGDRVVRLSLQSLTEQNYLLLELTARHANMFLLHADESIGGSFFPNRSELRKLIPGEPYVPPLFQAPALSTNRFEKAADPETAIESYYLQKEADAAVDDMRTHLLRTVTTARKKAEKLIRALAVDLDNATQSEALSTAAEVLKANLGQIEKGRTKFDGTDFNGQPITIRLDPKLGPVENMKRMFDKASRLRRAAPPIEARIAEVSAQAARLCEQESQILQAEAETLRGMIEDEMFSGRPRNKAASPKSPNANIRLPYREFSISSGRPARVGRGAKDNDDLTLRHAKPDDLWLHVRNARGSHVVVPMGRKEDPHPDMLIDAAHLAAHFSSLKGQTDVEVLYTRRRYVQKKKGSAPGTVQLLKEKCINLRVEEERIRRLLHGQPVFNPTNNTVPHTPLPGDDE